jgi:hypothetical protein
LELINDVEVEVDNDARITGWDVLALAAVTTDLRCTSCTFGLVFVEALDWASGQIISLPNTRLNVV